MSNFITDRPAQCKNTDFGLTAESTNEYYKQGYLNIINGYKKINLIDQNLAKKLNKWVDDEGYLYVNAKAHVRKITKFYRNQSNRTLPSNRRGQGSIPRRGNNTDIVGLTRSACPKLIEIRKGVSKNKSASEPVPEEVWMTLSERQLCLKNNKLQKKK